MQFRWLGITIATLLLAGTAQAADWGWSARAGLDYDYISHNYYLLTVDTLGLTADSLTELKSASDLIDERGGFLRLDVEKKGDTRFSLSSRLFLTNEKLRTLFDLGLDWGVLRLRSNTEFKSYSDREDFSLYQSQVRSSSRLGLELPAGDASRIELSQELEYIGYDENEPSVIGYYQSESRLRLRHRLSDLSDLSISVRFDLRDAYDSTQLDFNRLLTDFEYARISGSGYLQASLYMERRNYAYAGENDYLYLSPGFFFDRSITETLSLAPTLEMHYYDYDLQDLATFSHLRWLAEARIKYHYRLLSTFSVGLGAEGFSASDDLYSDQDYRSLKLLAGFETFSATWLTLTLDGEFGHRDYSAGAAEYYSDYDFVRFDLLADVQLTNRLRLSLLGGTDFEYHNEKEDDIFVHLLSATLSYQIK